ncbi:MAG TPA: DUF2851 family protein [Flavobacteriaceae bacterium]|nr:DUF2851 family protein [Flavobacteriaceae bacterium]
MQEAFLHYLWKFKKFQWNGARTTAGEELVLMNVGNHNEEQAGPDFFNAKIRIGEQKWAGNVEIHLKASDWYLHRHETDPAYDNVILHVVWENDAPIFRKDNSVISTLELKNLTSPEMLGNYKTLLENPTQKWINCENDFFKFDDFELNNWLERMYVERLENKAQLILKLLASSSNNWEATLFKMLAKNFGLNVNGEVFLEMACSFPFAVAQKLFHRPEQSEALFFGQTSMLEGDSEDAYFKQLQKEYRYLKAKFGLENLNVPPVHYFRLRPDNFPGIRLSQLADLFSKRPTLFSEIISRQTKEEFYELFQVETSVFWQNHYTFEKQSSKRRKKLTNDFIDLLLINTIVPLKFCYGKFQGDADHEKLLSLIKSLKSESNKIISKFNTLREKTSENALNSQALLHLKKNYCDKNACLHCALGTKLLQQT